MSIKKIYHEYDDATGISIGIKYEKYLYQSQSKYQNIEIIMASTKFLKFALSNDSGVSHMLSTNHCSLIKLFGPKDSKKFTPKMNKLITISADENNSNKIEDIKISRVIDTIDSLEDNNV